MALNEGRGLNPGDTPNRIGKVQNRVFWTRRTRSPTDHGEMFAARM